ncbi:UPF0058 family protein [Methanothermococcus sp.]|uniref:UPF0058 family protein n=1 Tax=Methanothermococcus sp. TaxID=2614238 RepID=UPI0025EA7FC6|nr:UPF0058 family protein [Methanothermococcus sp.]
MHKEQLMELHQFFVHVYRELVPSECSCEYMKIYEELDIRPHHIHKLKTEQRAAIFLLSACIADYLSQSDDSVSKNLSIKLLENAFKYINPKSENMKKYIGKYMSLLENEKSEHIENTV